jgi:hypothetical protein
MEEEDRRAIARIAAQHDQQRRAQAEIHASPFIALHSVLSPTERDELFASLLEMEPEFRSNEMGGRRGLVLHPAPLDIIVGRLQQLKAEIVTPFGFAPEDIESPAVSDLAVSASGHGDFFGPHRDDTAPTRDPAVESRRVSVAFHLFKEPKRFSGGALRLHNYRIENGMAVAVPSFQAIDPEDNTLVAFLSSTRHEVDTVRLENNHFADRRFSITGSFTQRT